jgi:purine-nucleoside/S-methyl-5'-thioadenosine phosphorylase / adenosine deaminase
VSLRQRESLGGRAGPAWLALTDRRGGNSQAPYDGANLGEHVGDRLASVEANRFSLAADLGIPREHLVFMNQVHGSTVTSIDGPLDGPAPEADALVTATRGLALVVLVADCVPVVLADPDAGVVGVAHAGRRGLAAAVAERVVEAMTMLGASSRSIVARVGPSVCPRCYAVPALMRDDVASAVPVSASVDRHGNPALDIAAGVLSQLAPICADVDVWTGCTREDLDLYSHRRDGVTGRFAGVAMLVP